MSRDDQVEECRADFEGIGTAVTMCSSGDDYCVIIYCRGWVQVYSKGRDRESAVKDFIGVVAHYEGL